MWIEAIVSREDFASLATELFPLSIHLGKSDSDHYLLLSAATTVTLVEGRGLRFTCNAQIRWPVLGMDLPINVEAVTVLIEPSVPDGSQSLLLGVQLEHANVSWLPALLDAKIVHAVNDALREKRDALSWNFAQALSHEFPLPELLQPLRALDLSAGWGKVRVTAEAMVLVVSFNARAVRTKQKADVPAAAGPRDTALQLAGRVSAPPAAIERASPKTIAIASALVLSAGCFALLGGLRIFGGKSQRRSRNAW